MIESGLARVEGNLALWKQKEELQKVAGRYAGARGLPAFLSGRSSANQSQNGTWQSKRAEREPWEPSRAG